MKKANSATGRPNVLNWTHVSVLSVRQITSFATANPKKNSIVRLVSAIHPSCVSGSVDPITARI